MNNVTKMCCLCLKNTSTLENICSLDADNVRIADKFNYCMPELESNAKQNVILICHICRDHLNIFYDFKCSGIQNYKHFINYVSQKKQNETNNASKSSEKPVCVFVKTEVHSDEETENKSVNAETSNFKLNEEEKVVIDVEPDLLNINDLSSNDEEDPLNMIQEDNCSEIDESVVLPEIPAISPEIKVQKIIYNLEKQIHCTICPAYFPNQHSLKLHMKEHNIDKPFTCTICQKSFSEKCNLTRHYKVHTGDKPFTCSVCQNKFSQKQHMDNHMRLHTGERPFSCTLCEKKFTERSKLSRHLRLHTGEKSYMCDVCQKQFSRKHHLDIHIRLHTGEKPFSCEICQKHFTHKNSLNIHMKVHNNNT